MVISIVWLLYGYWMRQVAGPQQEYRYEKTHFIKVGFFCLQGWILLQFSLRSNWRPLKRKEPVLGQVQIWLRGLDSNQRPLGYEPNELPGCSTPRHISFLSKWYYHYTACSYFCQIKPSPFYAFFHESRPFLGTLTNDYIAFIWIDRT